MPRSVKCNCGGVKGLWDKLEKMRESQVQQFIESCAKELAARLLSKVIKHTPSRRGFLRRGWTAKKEAEAIAGAVLDAATYANALTIEKKGSNYCVEIINPMHYASYVEYGHRTANHKGWVEGKFMLTISEQELEAQIPSIIEKKLESFLRKCFS